MISDKRLRKLNVYLLIILFFMAGYIMVLPFLPTFNWWIRYDAPLLSKPISITVDSDYKPDKNRLLIPALGLNHEIFDGDAVSTVNEGVWRRPNTSEPSKQSNTVLVGHRFTYNGASVFYHLDKVKLDEELMVFWEGEQYRYKVYDISVVTPDAIEVEAPTDEPILTLYTCTPLLTAKDRLVIKARLI